MPASPHPGPPPGRTPQKVKDMRGTLIKLLRFVSRFKFYLLATFLFAIGSCVFNTVGPRVLSMATTELFRGVTAKSQGTGGIDFYLIGQILATTLCLYLLSSACTFVQGLLMTRVSQDLCYELRGEIVAKINRLPVSHFDRTSTGDTLSRITNDVDTLGQSLNQGVTQLITSLVTVVGVLAMMLSMNVVMTVVVLCVIPVSALLVRLIVRLSQKYFVAQQSLLGSVNAQVEETVSGHTELMAFNQQAATREKFNETNSKLFTAAWKSQFMSGVMKPFMDVVGNAAYVVVAVMGCAFAAQGTITVGDIQAFIQYVRNFTQPISQLAQVSNVLQQLGAAAERIFDFLSEPEEEECEGVGAEGEDECEDDGVENSKGDNSRSTEGAKGSVMDGIKGYGAEVDDAKINGAENSLVTSTNTPTPHLKGDVDFSNVCFAYDVDPIIKNFTAHVKQGQTVALVGPTGSGKTTIVKLLMRFYDVNSGIISIGGTDIRHVDRHILRQNIGMVLQDTWLFHGTIRDNIRYGHLDATDDEVERAARAGCAHDFIKKLPGGYDFVINEEADNISAGQKQLLTIARAILANRDILILDEATSNVDTQTETRIQEALHNLMRDKTCFVIAHRLSTIKNADVLIVMRDGEIIEHGTHEALLSQDEFYAQIYNSQFAD